MRFGEQRQKRRGLFPPPANSWFSMTNNQSLSVGRLTDLSDSANEDDVMISMRMFPWARDIWEDAIITAGFCATTIWSLSLYPPSAAPQR